MPRHRDTPPESTNTLSRTASLPLQGSTHREKPQNNRAATTEGHTSRSRADPEAVRECMIPDAASSPTLGGIRPGFYEIRTLEGKDVGFTSKKRLTTVESGGEVLQWLFFPAGKGWIIRWADDQATETYLSLCERSDERFCVGKSEYPNTWEVQVDENRAECVIVSINWPPISRSFWNTGGTSSQVRAGDRSEKTQWRLTFVASNMPPSDDADTCSDFSGFDTDHSFTVVKTITYTQTASKEEWYRARGLGPRSRRRRRTKRRTSGAHTP